MSPQPTSTQACIANGWDLNFGRTTPLRRSVEMKPGNSFHSAGSGVIQSRERMSRCQPWHRHADGGADGAMRWHFCSPFLPTAVATSRQKAGGDTAQTDKTEWGGWWDDEKGKEWWKIANLHLCLLPIASIPLPFNRCCNISLFVTSYLTSPQSLPSFYSLILPWRRTGAALCRKACPRYVEEALLFLMRYPARDFKHSPRPSPLATPAQKWWTGRG